MVTFRTLAHGDFDTVVACFNEAFSDYVVPFSLTAPQLREICARRGIGLALLARSAAEAEGNVRILNIDARNDGIEAFLRARGAEQFVRQREMERPLRVELLGC